MNTVNTNTINVNGNLALKAKRERMSVPFIVSTTPVQGKEIDLTFVQFAQRKHAATTYIDQVAKAREAKANQRKINKEKAENVCLGLLFAVAFSLCFFGIAVIGMVF